MDLRHNSLHDDWIRLAREVGFTRHRICSDDDDDDNLLHVIES